jgi:hypothetical protein
MREQYLADSIGKLEDLNVKERATGYKKKDKRKKWMGGGGGGGGMRLKFTERLGGEPTFALLPNERRV